MSKFCKKLEELGFEFYVEEEVIHPKLLKLTFDKVYPKVLELAQKYFDSIAKGETLDDIKIIEVTQNFSDNVMVIKEVI